jgi:hypothetical protein|tara:strand:- start:2138 stop:2335 length:198 start_codon:yes stop_codon:yes gene_type:complete
MDEVDVAQYIFTLLRERRSLIREVLENNGVKGMEQYRELMGELNGLNLIHQELSDMLEKQEKLHD